MQDLKDHRYKAIILKIERTDGGGNDAEFFDALVYHDLRYDEVVAMQAFVKNTNIQDKLIELGFKMAAQGGFTLPTNRQAASGK